MKDGKKIDGIKKTRIPTVHVAVPATVPRGVVMLSSTVRGSSGTGAPFASNPAQTQQQNDIELERSQNTIAVCHSKQKSAKYEFFKPLAMVL